MAGSKDINYQNEYYKNYKRLSRRAQNIFNAIGDEQKMLEHYLKYNTFLNIKNVGEHTNMELCSYSNYLLKNNQQLSEPIIKNVIVDESELDLYEYYLFLKNQYSVRTKNIINKIEDLYLKSGYRRIDENFVKKFFLESYDYSTVKGLGALVMYDINEIKDKIQQKCGILPSEEDCNPILKLFNNSIDTAEYNSIFEDGEIQFFRLIVQYLFRVKLKERYQTFFLHYFFENNFQDENELGLKLDITRERIRQLINSFKLKYIPEAIVELENFAPEEFQKFCSVDSSKYYMIALEFEKAPIDGNSYKPNAFFVEILNTILFENTHQSLHTLLFEHKNRHSFKEFSEQILISKTFIKQFNFSELIDWLDVQIYEFALEEFDYNFEVLIKRFYEEVLNTDIPKDIVKDIIFLLDERRRDNWDEIQEAINKRKHKKEKYAFIDCIYNFIKEKGEAVKTEEIVKHLHENNYEYDNVQVLSHLNKLKNQFYSIGYGHWNIKIEGSEDKTTGTIRAFVYKLLMENKDPLHISKLVRIINKERGVNERSVLTNLKVDEYKRFVFFNCSYIGLKDKEYDKYWYNLPKLNPGKLISEMKDAIIDDNFFDFMEEKYGYPKEHIRHLIRNRESMD